MIELVNFDLQFVLHNCNRILVTEDTFTENDKYVKNKTIKVAIYYVYSISQLSCALNHYTLM